MQILAQNEIPKKYIVELIRKSNCKRCKHSWQMLSGEFPIYKNHRKESFFCSIMFGMGGCGWQYIKTVGKDEFCPVCGCKVVRKSTFDKSIERMEKILSLNEKALAHVDPILNAQDYANFGLKIPFLIGKDIFMIPLKDIIALSNIKPNIDKKEDHTQLVIFFEHVRNTCQSFKM